MATPASTPRTPFKFDISNLLPEGHEKALKQAFYNVAATVFVVFVSAACVAVYYVLEPFLRPLLWAVLFGSVLHPFKHGMTVVLKRWLQSLQVSGTPLTVGALTSPFFVVDHISEQMWNFTMQYALLFITIVGCVSVSFLIYSCVPDFMTLFFYNMLSRLLNGASMLLEFCHGAALFVWTVVVGYIIILSVWWTPNTRPYLIYLSPIVWTILICHLVSIAGSLRLTILLTLVALMVIGFLADIKGRYSDSATAAITVEQSNEEESHALTPMQAIRSGLAWLRGTEESCSEITPDIPDTSEKFDSHQNVQVDPSTPERTRPTSLSQSPFEETCCEEKMSNFYIYGLMWSCLLAQVWLHLWLFNLLLIPCMYMGLKHAV